MPEIPPHNSIVAIKSHRYGTYVSACSDHKSVTLQKVDDPNKLPKNCLWTLIRRENITGYPIGALRFISCYGRHLAVKGFIFREVCQDNPITGYTTLALGFANWTYDRGGTSYGGGQGYRLMVSLSGYYLWATEHGQVCMHFNPFYLCTEPEVYWTIHHIQNNDNASQLVPATPREMRSCNDEDRHENRGISIHVDVPIYNNPMAINTGGNVNNGRGEQHNGGVNAANTSKKQYG